eukprot:COSAG03_NODE_23430_length_280_cov_0.574586_1_plen_29_part_10
MQEREALWEQLEVGPGGRSLASCYAPRQQ